MVHCQLAQKLFINIQYLFMKKNFFSLVSSCIAFTFFCNVFAANAQSRYIIGTAGNAHVAITKSKNYCGNHIAARPFWGGNAFAGNMNINNYTSFICRTTNNQPA
jgi:hypothetical protein